jgi:ABC-2 type transport system permease protein
MLEITRYDGRRRVRGTIALTLLLGLFAALIVWLFPFIAEASADIDAYIESLPESFREGFGAESYGTIEGFLAGELYQFIWVLLLGLYMAYSAAGTLAGDIESERIHLVLATSRSRVGVATEKFLSLGVPIVTLNLVMPLFVFAATLAVDYPVDPFYLGAVHLFSVPYLLVCAGIGLLLSVVVSRGDVAQRAAIAFVFLLFLLESVTVGTDYDWLGLLSPTHYFDPTEILVEETFDVAGAVLLLAAAAALVVVALAVFRTRDV